MVSAKIAFLGPRGTFSQTAAEKYQQVVAPQKELVAYETIYSAIKAVENREVSKAVVPIENSVEGSVTTTLDLLVNPKVLIEAEIDLPITQSLLAWPGTQLRQITEVISHPQALAQCQDFLRRTWQQLQTHKSDSTAEAAATVKRVAQPYLAAIGYHKAAELYGLEVVAWEINDYADNLTRFVVIGQQLQPFTAGAKTSLVFSLAKDQPGGLYEALGVFAGSGINLTKIESRPTKKEIGDYLFYVDLEGHVATTIIHRALDKIQKMASFYKLLGSYPQL